MSATGSFALTEPVPTQVNGRVREVVLTVTPPTAYPTNGFVFDANVVCGMKQIQTILILDPTTGHIFSYDYTNNKIVGRWCAGSGAAMSEITNGTNLSTAVFRMIVRGL